MCETNNDNATTTPAEYAKERLAKLLRKTVWLVPIVAVANLVYAAIRLGLAPEDWQKPLGDTSQSVIGFNPEPYSCITASVIMLAYWLARDGWEVIRRTTVMLGIKPLWERVKAERLAEERAAGRAEGLAEGQSQARAEGHAEGQSQGRAEGRAELLAELGLTDPKDSNAAQPKNEDR